MGSGYVGELRAGSQALNLRRAAKLRAAGASDMVLGWMAVVLVFGPWSGRGSAAVGSCGVGVLGSGVFPSICAANG